MTTDRRLIELSVTASQTTVRPEMSLNWQQLYASFNAIGNLADKA